MDVNNPSELALAAGLAPSGDPIALPPLARWRQRAVGRCRAAPASEPHLPGRRAVLPEPPLARRPAAMTADSGRVQAASDTSEDPASHARTVAHHPAAAPPATAIAHPAEDAEAPDIADGTHPLAPPSAGDAFMRAGTPAEAEPTADAAAPDVPIEPQQAPRDIELWLLARRAQGAALRLDFELRTALARQVFRRDFVYVSRQLHALEASRRVQGLDRARLNDALTTLRQRAEAIHAFMAQRAAELHAAIDARGPASARIAFARPARFQATIVSPGAHRFLSLLMQADETLARLEMAWLLGLVEPAARSALVSDCRRALLGFKDLACDLRRAVGLLVQEVNAQRQEDCLAEPED